MTRERTAGVCLSIVFTSVTIVAQQTAEPGRTGSGPASSVVEASHPLGGVTPWRRVRTRSQSGNRETVVETVESPGPDGTFEPVQETIAETTRTGPDTARTQHDVFGFGARQRTLFETVQTERGTSADGTTSSVQSASVANLDGRVALGSRQVEETRPVGPSGQRSDVVTLVPGINESVSESERRQYTEQMVSPGVMRHESVQLRRDVNGGWQTTETRSGETRDVGPAAHVSEETVQRLDASGSLAVAERSYTRRSDVNGREQVVIETHSHDAEGFARSDGRLALSQRVHRTTTVTADGGRESVEEVESRSPAAPNDPMRVIRRTVTTERKTGLDRWIVETLVFELDANGRLVPAVSETETCSSTCR